MWHFGSHSFFDGFSHWDVIIFGGWSFTLPKTHFPWELEQFSECLSYWLGQTLAQSCSKKKNCEKNLQSSSAVGRKKTRSSVCGRSLSLDKKGPDNSGGGGGAAAFLNWCRSHKASRPSSRLTWHLSSSRISETHALFIHSDGLYHWSTHGCVRECPASCCTAPTVPSWLGWT